jgi:hypothetical protein
MKHIYARPINSKNISTAQQEQNRGFKDKISTKATINKHQQATNTLTREITTSSNKL